MLRSPPAVADGRLFFNTWQAIQCRGSPLQYTLTMAVNGSGSTSPPPGANACLEGAPVSITAIPAAGWRFANWIGDVANPLSPTTTVTMNGAKTVTANFKQDTPLAGRIAFVSRRDGNSEIYVMNADGTNQVRVTDHLMDDYHPSWSPDGKKIAFVSWRDGDPEIYVMNTDGSNPMRLTKSPGPDEQPAWSPDGTRIAFSSVRSGNPEIYVMNADGSNPMRLTNTPGINIGNFTPAWSPDGKKIAFVSNRDFNTEIYVLEVANPANQIRLTNNTVNDEWPTWSPDGSKIVFVSRRDNDDEIYVMNADGSNPVRLTNIGTLDQEPCWSPDGNRIAFRSHRDAPNADIYVMYDNGNNPTRLTNSPSDDMTPDWAVGNWVAPTVLTNDATNLTVSGARLNGDLSSFGSASQVWAKFLWGTAPGNLPYDTVPVVFLAPGKFHFDISSLNPNTTYYYKTIAVGDGTSYGEERSFTTPTPYTLTINIVGSGTTSPSGVQSYSPGTVVSITAIPAAGWAFSHWSGGATGNANPITVTVNANTVITANFVPSGIIPIGNIKQNPPAYQGQTITVSGAYRGWGAAYGSPPVTRSDWVIEDNTGFMYVTGSSLGLRYPADVGKPVTVKGVVRLKNGQPYIEIARK